MLVESFVLGRDNGLLEFLRRVFDLDIGAAFLAELTNQFSFRAVYLERNLGLVGRQNFD